MNPEHLSFLEVLGLRDPGGAMILVGVAIAAVSVWHEVSRGRAALAIAAGLAGIVLAS